MKTKFTSLLLLLAFALMSSLSVAQQAKDDFENPNFTYIDGWDFYPNPDYDPSDPTSPEFLTLGVSLWWTPEGSGSTAGIILEDDQGNPITYREHETETINEITGSTGAMKLAIAWDNEVEYSGTASHLVRQHMPAGNANIAARQFLPGQALEVFVYGDGSGNRFRFMTRDGIPTLEGSQWVSIDWVGWKRITWDYNNPDNVVGWVNGNGEMDAGTPFYFDSFQITKDAEGTTQSALIYFDDFRIVDPFTVNFNIAGADGTEVISINNMAYEEGVTEFTFFPGEYQYFVEKDGFVTAIGTFEVDNADLAIDVTLVAGDDPEFAATFTIIGAEEQILNDATVTIGDETLAAAPYVFQLTPGFYTYTVNRELYFETTGTFVVTDSNVFVNVTMEEIPDVYDRVMLSWDITSTASTAAYRAEHYSVWIASVEADQAFDAADYEMVFEETLSTELPSWEYQARTLDISAYQQQNIRVAFRHHNSTDNDRIVIDNIKIEGVVYSEEVADVLLHEDFEGGVPVAFDPNDPIYDEEWMPEGWLAVDADNDGFNWYFAIRVEQDLSYKAHMRSQSWDAVEGALAHDNWLVTPMVGMPWVFFYNVSFDVKDQDGAALAGATITIDGMEYEAGVNSFSLANGTYSYEVSLDAYETTSGTFVVDAADATVEVTLNLIPLFDVTFNVNMNQSTGFVPGETDVYFTGSFFEWEIPGSLDESQLQPTDNAFIFTRTLQLAGGTYEYKYFDGPTFDDGEWVGDPNRTVVVEGDMVVNDVFSVPTSVNEVAASSISMFPNPARQQVSITADSRINEVAIYNLAGQQVYIQQVNNTAHTIRLDGFNNGIYMVRILSAEGVKTYKLQVVK